MRRIAIPVALSSVLVAMPAVAGPKEDARGRGASPTSEARADKLFQEAETEYQAGRFQAAIDRLLEAQRLAPDPILDYNLARAYEGIADFDHALASYRAYLQGAPNAKDRGAVEARVKNVEAMMAEQKAKADAAARPADPKKNDDAPPKTIEERDPSPIPWVIASIGALGIGAGGVLGGLASSKSSDADDPATSGADAVSLHDDAQSFALGANIAFIAGGTIALAGTVWGIVDVVTAGPSEPATTSARIELRGTTARFVVRY